MDPFIENLMALSRVTHVDLNLETVDLPATVHRIIRRHPGKVGTESAVGNGSTFRFTLGIGINV